MLFLCILLVNFFFFFFFNDTATTEIYTLSLHDALPILLDVEDAGERPRLVADDPHRVRSEEHTSELQSRQYLVCRLLLEKKKTKQNTHQHDAKQKTQQTTKDPNTINT